MRRGVLGGISLSFLVAVCAPLAVTAAPPPLPSLPEHAEHEADARLGLEADAARTLGQALDAAMQRAPGRSAIAARQREADALSARGRSWIGGAPSFSVRQQTDRWQAATGLREAEAGLDLPLWRPGQRGAIEAEGSATNLQAQAEQLLHRWQVAGEVRERYWSVIESRAQVALAQRDLQAFQQLEQDVTRRVEAGDAAPLERLSAEIQRREREALLHEAEVRLADSAFGWRTVTGWDVLPAPPAETAQGDVGYPPEARARAAVDRAHSVLALAEQDGAGAPRLLIGARSEAAGGADAVDSLGATLTIPFGGGAHRRAALSAPQLALARSQDELEQVQREGVLLRHEAEHELHAQERALELAAERLALAQDELRLARRAYQIGETSLAERVLSEIRGAEAERKHLLAAIARDRALSRYNHYQGVLP